LVTRALANEHFAVFPDQRGDDAFHIGVCGTGALARGYSLASVLRPRSVAIGRIIAEC
jgi:hypothetical protein